MRRLLPPPRWPGPLESVWKSDGGHFCTIVSGNGTELTSQAILAWQEERGVEWHYIAPCKPMQNSVVGSFSDRLRDEHLFTNVPEARRFMEEWRTDYNTNGPHTSLRGA